MLSMIPPDLLAMFGAPQADQAPPAPPTKSIRPGTNLSGAAFGPPAQPSSMKSSDMPWRGVPVLPVSKGAAFGPPQAQDAAIAANAPPMLNRMTGKPAPPPAIAMGPGGTNLNPPPPQPPGVAPGMNIPSAPVPRGAAFGPPATQSSDDPGITGMPALPKPPDLSNSPINTAYSRYQALAKQRAAIPLPDANALKPKWYDRLAGAATGFAAGWGNAERGAELGGKVTTRRFDTAKAKYDQQTGALDKQLSTEREGLPYAEAASRVPQEDFTNKMGVAKERREQVVGQGRVDSAEAHANEWKTQAEKLQDLIDHPKTTPPKTADEAVGMAYLEPDPVKKAILLHAASVMHQQEIDRVQQGRPEKPAGPKPAARKDFREVDDRRKKADDDAEKQFNKDIGTDTENPINLDRQHGVGKTPDEGKADEASYQRDKAKYDRAVQRLQQQKKQNEQAYYEDIKDLGGSTPGGTPNAAQPAGKPAPQVGHVMVHKKSGERIKITKVFPNGTVDGDPVK